MNPPVRLDTSPPLLNLHVVVAADDVGDCEDWGLPPAEDAGPEAAHSRLNSSMPSGADGVEQTSQGFRPPAVSIASFDGLGFGFNGPQGKVAGKNPSDNSLAIGPDHIVQIVNSRMAVFSKKGTKFLSTGQALYGPVVTNNIFSGFGGQCEHRVSGDAVVRYDQLADRWLYVLPIFRRPPDDPKGPYSICYAVSSGPDPLGPYHRYEFKRPLFPDYPRPAIWPDGYYIPTSTGDTVIQKQACVADRTKMLAGLEASEQCVIIDGVNFLNNSDLDGQALPPPGSPNIIMAAGGTQLHQDYEDDGIYVYKFYVDWNVPANTRVSPPTKIKVAPYHYLCDGQLTKCVPQLGTETRLDAQGDKLMQRLVYRNLGDHESIVGLHSINTKGHGGGVRWYEFRFDRERNPFLYQQGTYAPDENFRWMGSIAIDRRGNIGIGYSFGGPSKYAGQRFAARLEADVLGQLTFHETVLAEGAAAQTNTLRWEDYTSTAMDPSDNCTFWYVGDYFKADAPSYTTRIGAFRLPGCLQGKISGTVYFDSNHNGRRDPGEPGLSGQRISSGPSSKEAVTDRNGAFNVSLDADPAYSNTEHMISLGSSSRESWMTTNISSARAAQDAKVTVKGPAYSLEIRDGDDLTGFDFGAVCSVTNSGARDTSYWARGTIVKFWTTNGKAFLLRHEAEWVGLLNSKLYLTNRDGSRFSVSGNGVAAYRQLRAWMRAPASSKVSNTSSVQLAAMALNLASGFQDGNVTVADPVREDWPSVQTVMARVSQLISEHTQTSYSDGYGGDLLKYADLLKSLNRNIAKITPASPANCPSSTMPRSSRQKDL